MVVVHYHGACARLHLTMSQAAKDGESTDANT